MLSRITHIAEIEPNLEAEAEPGVAITDPKSHASLAREFLATYCDDRDLLAMVQ